MLKDLSCDYSNMKSHVYFRRISKVMLDLAIVRLQNFNEHEIYQDNIS